MRETVFSILWVKTVAEHLITRCMWLTQFCVCSQCGGSSVGLTSSCYRQAGLSIRDVLPVLVAYYFYQILVNSWPDFQLQCRKMRHEPTLCVYADAGFWPDYFILFFLRPFWKSFSIEIHVIWWIGESQLLLRVFLKVESPPVAETFILGQELLLIERDNAFEKGHESKGNHPKFHSSEVRTAGEIHRQDSIINFHCFFFGVGG